MNRRKLTRFAWYNNSAKTWFITTSRTSAVPPGSVLRMELDCAWTDKPVGARGNSPLPGDVVTSTDGRHIEILGAKPYSSNDRASFREMRLPSK